MHFSCVTDTLAARSIQVVHPSGQIEGKGQGQGSHAQAAAITVKMTLRRLTWIKSQISALRLFLSGLPCNSQLNFNAHWRARLFFHCRGTSLLQTHFLTHHWGNTIISCPEAAESSPFSLSSAPDSFSESCAVAGSSFICFEEVSI